MARTSDKSLAVAGLLTVILMSGRVIQFFRTVQGSGKTSVMQVDVTGAKERKIDTPVDGSDPAWGPILP